MSPPVRAVVAAAAVAIGLVCPHTTRAAFELGDASPGSLGAASPEGPRLWMAPGYAYAGPPPGASVAFHRASLFDAPGLAADGVALSLAGDRVGGTLEAMQVSSPAALERTLRLSVREGAVRAVRVGLCAERLDLAVAGAPRRGGWALGAEVAGRVTARGTAWRVVAAADRAARSRDLGELGVLAEFRAEATVATAAAAFSVADRWSAAGSHRPRVALDLPLGRHALLRVGRSASPGAVGLALAVRAGRCQVSAGRLEDPSGAGIVAVEVSFLTAPRARSPQREDLPRVAESGLGEPVETGAARHGLRRDVRTGNYLVSRGYGSIAPGGPGSTPPSVPLWGPGAFATMRHDTQIRRIAVGGSPPNAGWLPEAVEDLEAPETLDDPDEPARAGASFATGGETSSRLWWRSADLSAVVARRGEGREGGAVLGRGGLRLAVGALATPGMGLVGERSRLTRAARGTSLEAAPREALRPAYGSGADASGFAVAWGEGAERSGRPASRGASRLAARLVGGSRARGEGSIVAGEIRVALGAASAMTLRAARWREETGPARVAAGFGWSRRRGPGRVAAELVGDASGLHADLAAAARERSLGAAVRWRHRAGATRPGGLELEAGWSTRAAAARFRWRAWSAAAARSAHDDGRAELDLRAGRSGPGAVRLRLGVRPRHSGGAGGERLAVGDAVAAREPGRSLRLFASVRATPSGATWRYGRTLGASLRLERARRAAIDLRAEAVRAESGAAAAGSAFTIAGRGSLRSQTRSGVRLAARGWAALGDWRIGAAVDDEETRDTTGTRAPRASLWLTWNHAPGAP